MHGPWGQNWIPNPLLSPLRCTTVKDDPAIGVTEISGYFSYCTFDFVAALELMVTPSFKP